MSDEVDIKVCILCDRVISHESFNHAQVHEVARRITELSLLESALYHEGCQVSASPTLAFSSPPSCLSDPPAGLQLANQDSRNLAKFRNWLETQQNNLRLLPPLGHRDADRRRGILLDRIKGRLEDLALIVRNAWEREKVLVGLYGFPDEKDLDGPKIYRTGAFSAVWEITLTDSIMTCRAPAYLEIPPSAIHPSGPRGQ